MGAVPSETVSSLLKKNGLEHKQLRLPRPGKPKVVAAPAKPRRKLRPLNQRIERRRWFMAAFFTDRRAHRYFNALHGDVYAVPRNEHPHALRKKGLVSYHLDRHPPVCHRCPKTVDDKPFGGGPGIMMYVPDDVRRRGGGGTSGPAGLPVAPVDPCRVNRSISGSPGELAAEQRLLADCWADMKASMNESSLGFKPMELSHRRFCPQRRENSRRRWSSTQLSTACCPACWVRPTVRPMKPFANGLLEHPQYTRPRDFRGMEVPEVLLSGNHKTIAAWKLEQRKLRTERGYAGRTSGRHISTGSAKETVSVGELTRSCHDEQNP